MKKSYWPLLLWAFLLILGMLLPAFLLPEGARPYLSRALLGFVVAWIALLMLYIGLSGRAYYLNGGPSYEACVEAPAAARRYGLRYFYRFAIAAVAYGLWCIPATVFTLSFVFDVFIFLVLLIFAAISTVWIRFE